MPRSIATLLLTLAITTAAAASPPAPTGSADRVTGLYYAPDPDHLPPVTWSLAGSASTSIRVATWKLSDGTLASVLCTAATSGVSVGVALDLTGGSTTAQQQIARKLTLSGGTVWNCPIPRRIANNFLTVDGVYTATGPYYYSPTALQIGNYLLTISGTNAAAHAEATFASLISGGSLAMHQAPHRAAAPIPANVELYFSPHGGCTAAAAAVINQAKSTLRLQAYTFTSPQIIAACVAAKARHVDIQIQIDKHTSEKYQKNVNQCVSAGISVWLDGAHPIAHNKVILADDETVVTGSYNFSLQAESNTENLLVIRNAAVAAIYRKDWDSHRPHCTAAVRR